MLLAISRDDHTNVNGRLPTCLEDVGEIWVSGVVHTAQDKGVLTSLKNAKLVKTRDTGDGMAVELTQAGWDEIQ